MVKTPLNTQIKGFTLIEVLITLLITAVAILGISLLQAGAMMKVDDAAQRSHATSLTYEIIDRIRANQSALSSYAPKTIGYGQTAIADLASNPTTVAQRAQKDLYDWQQKLVSVGGRKNLYQAVGTISRSGNVFTVQLSWKSRTQPGTFQTRNIISTTEF